MPNLDVKVLRYMGNDEFRVLTAVEMGMKNHEIVPSSLIEAISGLKRGGAFKLIRSLAKNKLVQHASKPYDGYRLTSKGYDFLALKALCKRGAIASVGIQIGVGKESDIFTALRPNGEEVAIKLHKLGRSFKTLKNNRDYTRPGQSFNWLYMSRLSALKEFAFMLGTRSRREAPKQSKAPNQRAKPNHQPMAPTAAHCRCGASDPATVERSASARPACGRSGRPRRRVPLASGETGEMCSECFSTRLLHWTTT